MKILYLILYVVGTLASAHAEVIADPVQDFLSTMWRTPDDQLLKLVAHVNRKGGDEVFLSYSHNVNGKAGNAWSVYAPVPGGYQLLDDEITFQTSPFLYIGTSESLGGIGLITWWPGGGGTGNILGFIFDGVNVQQKLIAEVEIEGKNRELLKKYFPENGKINIEITPADKLPPREYYFPNEPEKSTISIDKQTHNAPVISRASSQSTQPLASKAKSSKLSLPVIVSIIFFVIIGSIILFLGRRRK